MQKILQESLQNMAPMQRMQVSKKNSKKLSEKVRQKMAERDMAYSTYKETKNQDDLRNLKKQTKKIQ